MSEPASAPAEAASQPDVDTEPAPVPTAEPTPEPTPEPKQSIAITADNFMDYFELKEVCVWFKDPEGKVIEGLPSVALCLKEEYSQVVEGETSIEIQYTAKYAHASFTMDYDGEAFSIGDIYSEHSPEEASYTYTFDGCFDTKPGYENQWVVKEIAGPSGSAPYGKFITVPLDFVIDSAAGNLVYMTE